MEERPLVAVAGVIYKDGKMLLDQRLDQDWLPNVWEFSGGKVDYGETPEDALKREIREELGIEIGNLRLLSVHSQLYQQQEKRRHVILVVYEADWVSGQVRCIECQDFVWVTLEEIDAYEVLPTVTAVVNELKKKKT